MYDVVVIGAGPAGCYAAKLLSQCGFDVHVLEEHAVIGEPVDCSGIIGVDAFREIEIPSDIRVSEIKKISFISPSNIEFHFTPSAPLAYMVNRAALDRFIAGKAMEYGAKFHLGTRVIDLDIHERYVEATVERVIPLGNGQSDNRSMECRLSGLNVPPGILGREPAACTTNSAPLTNVIHSLDGRVRTRMVILAGGPRYKLQRKLGMGEPERFLKTAQMEVPLKRSTTTKIFLGSAVAPGSFGWIAPFQRGGREFARIGVSAKAPATSFLKHRIDELTSHGLVDATDMAIRSWVIPISSLKRTYAYRVLAVGDAAGQTKPTTGGGIYYGILGAQAAARTVEKAFAKGDFRAAFLSRYEKEWRKMLGAEIRRGAFFRRLFEHLSDKDIDDLFRVVQSDGISASVSQQARFDWHKDVINFILRHPELGKIFLRGLFRSKLKNQ